MKALVLTILSKCSSLKTEPFLTFLFHFISIPQQSIKGDLIAACKKSLYNICLLNQLLFCFEAEGEICFVLNEELLFSPLFTHFIPIQYSGIGMDMLCLFSHAHQRDGTCLV